MSRKENTLNILQDELLSSIMTNTRIKDLVNNCEADEAL